MGGKILSKSKSDMLLMTTFVRQAKAVVIWQYGLSNLQERDTKLSKNKNAQKKSFYFVKVHIFWEGHKILQNLYLTFDYST